MGWSIRPHYNSSFFVLSLTPLAPLFRGAFPYTLPTGPEGTPPRVPGPSRRDGPTTQRHPEGTRPWAQGEGDAERVLV